MVTIVVDVLQAVAELRMAYVHHLLQSVLHPVGKVVLSGRQFMRCAATAQKRCARISVGSTERESSVMASSVSSGSRIGIDGQEH